MDLRASRQTSASADAKGTRETKRGKVSVNWSRSGAAVAEWGAESVGVGEGLVLVVVQGWPLCLGERLSGG